MKKDIRDFVLKELKIEMVKLSEPQYRAAQIFFWLYKKGVEGFADMANLGAVLKDKLDRAYTAALPAVSTRLKSCDGTEKFLFKLRDENYIESVLIYTEGRKTLCLSTQAGCRYSCAFCASGLKGFVRNLTPAEILGQIVVVEKRFNHRITNFVFMGMGEPLDNYDNVSKAIKIMNDPQGLGVAARRITISTCGITPAIIRLKELSIQINLSLSLHAAYDKLRDRLMPVNKIYPLEKVLKACEDFTSATGRIITLEYILLKGINDSREDADALSKIAKRLKAKINLLLYSPVTGQGLEPPAQKAARLFMDRLLKNRANVTLRKSKGLDIEAACGQLAGGHKN